MRKTLIILPTVLAVLSANCFAAEIDEIRFESGVAHVSGTAEKNAILSVTAVKKDAATPNNLNTGLVYDIRTSEKGEFEFSFIINDLPDGTDMSGWYTLRASDGEMAEKDFYFATEKGISGFIDELNSAKKNKDSEAFQKAFEDTDSKILECIGIDFTVNGDIKDEVIGVMFNNSTSGDLNRESVYEEYKKALGYVLINDGDADGIADFNPVYDEKEFCELDDKASEFIKEVIDDNSPYESYSDLEENYRKAYALYDINCASSAKLAQTLDKYSKLLELSSNSSYKYYNGASASVKADITRDIVDTLYDKKAYSRSELLEAIEKSVDANKGKTSGGSSGGSGGGGGRTTGYSVSESPVEPEKEIVEEVSRAVFSDLNEAKWATEAIEELYKRKIVSGTGQGLFEPQRAVTREEFVKMLVAATGLYTSGAECGFADTDKGEWYYPYISSAYEKGIVKGYEDNTFGIGESISREEAAVMLSRCANDVEAVREYNSFADETEISDWAYEHIIRLYESGIINGSDGKFNPDNMITRAEAAQMIYGYLKGGVQGV